MSNLHIGAGASVSWSRGGRRGTMRACLVVILWAFASPGYTLVAAGNLDHAVGELVRKIVSEGRLQGKSVFVGADDFFEEDTGYRLRLPLSDTLHTKCRTALLENEVDVAMVESEAVRVLHGRWRRESEGELHLTLFVAEPVERDGDAGAIVSLEGGEEALLPIDDGIREDITPTLRHWGRAAVRQLERHLPGSGTYRLHVPPGAIAARDVPRPESLGRLLLAYWRPEFAGSDRFTLAGPDRSDGELRGEAFVAGDRIVVTLTIRDRRQGTEVPAKVEPDKSLFGDMMGGLHGGSGSGGPDAGGGTGRQVLATLPAFATLSVRTVPSGARVRIATNDGATAYRKGMRLEPGRYRIEVEARDHEPFRQYLDVTGNTEYEISLCRLEQRTKRECTNEEVTRHRTERRRSTRSMQDNEIISLIDADLTVDDDLEELYEEFNGRPPRGNPRAELRSQLCWLAYLELEPRITRGCRRVDGSFVDDSHSTDCECELDGDYINDYCELTVDWECSVTKEVQVPYTTTEEKCEDKILEDRICPENQVTLRSH